MNNQNFERLVEIRLEILNLLSEASDLLRCSDPSTFERSKAYWLGHIDAALGEGQMMDLDYSFADCLAEMNPGCTMNPCEECGAHSGEPCDPACVMSLECVRNDG